MRSAWIRPLFVVAGLYDGILSLAFLFFPLAIFQWFEVTPPIHVGYVQFPALLLLIFAAMFFRIAVNLLGNCDLIPYGIALKAAYSGLVFWHDFTGGVPSMWIPWAWLDVMFMVLFLVAWRQTAKPAPA